MRARTALQFPLSEEPWAETIPWFSPAHNPSASLLFHAAATYVMNFNQALAPGDDTPRHETTHNTQQHEPTTRGVCRLGRGAPACPASCAAPVPAPPCPLPTPQSRHPPALRHDSHASHATRLPDLPAPCPCHATIVSSHGIISMLPRWCNTAAAQPACLRDALRLCDPATRTPNLRLCLSVPTPPHPPLWQESNACREDAP